MARAGPCAASAGAGLRAGHQSASLKHGSNSFQVARLLSQHSGAIRLVSFLTMARKLPEPHVIVNIFYNLGWNSASPSATDATSLDGWDSLKHKGLIVGRLYTGRQTCMPTSRCLGCISTGSLVGISII